MTGRILVVDDLLPNLKLLEVKLTSEYYEVKTAKSGKEALDMVAKHSFDVILMDVMMPGMDGFEACRRLKSDPKTMNIPVVMVTALTDVQDRVSGLQAGADDFLTKPINDLALLARIRSLIRLKTVTDELALRNQTGATLGLDDQQEFLQKLNSDGACIVVIDDNPSQSLSISNKLLEHGMNVKVIDHPDIAAEEVARDASFIDLVIISSQLKDSDGLRICTQLRSREETKYIPQIILVAEEDTTLLVRSLDMGVNDYIIIPLDANEVVARVNTQVKRKRYQDELKKSYQTSVSMALVDGLTGIYNRRYFDVYYPQLFKQSEAAAKPLSLCMIDIDFFKPVNDNYGHLAGDEILKQIATILGSDTRLTDLVARYGGEEFVLVLQTNLQAAANSCERIRQHIENNNFQISVPPGNLKITCSIGVATLKPGDTAITLMQRADKFLYKAKESGRNCVIIDKI